MEQRAQKARNAQAIQATCLQSSAVKALQPSRGLAQVSEEEPKHLGMFRVRSQPEGRKHRPRVGCWPGTGNQQFPYHIQVPSIGSQI